MVGQSITDETLIVETAYSSLMQENIIDVKRNCKKYKNALNDFKIKGLDEHNKSIQWIEETCEIMDAKICLDGKDRYGRFCESFDIYIKGKKSRIEYRINVRQSDKMGKILLNRIKEIDLNERNAKVIMNAFKEFVNLSVSWHNLGKSEWESICMHDDPSNHWPGDGVVAVMYALRDDLRSASDANMRTLRNTMMDSLPLYWMAGRTTEIDIHQIVEYIEILSKLNQAKNQDEHDKIVNKNNIFEIFTDKKNNLSKGKK